MPGRAKRAPYRLLKDLINDLGLAPKRLGMAMPPTFYNIVVVRPSCSVIGDYKGDARIWRMDTLVKKVRDDNPAVLDMVKIISQATLHLFATKVAAFHKPAPKPKLSLSYSPAGPSGALPIHDAASTLCQDCQGPLSAAEVRYCRENESRFGGRLICLKCQSYSPKAAPAAVSPPHQSPVRAENSKAPRCQACGAAVDNKVVFYCRIESRRFAGRLLCRACQPSTSKKITTAVPA